MNQIVYNEFKEKLKKFLIDDLNIESFNLYGPITENCWEQKYKILICNLESYDSSDKIRDINLAMIKRWFGSCTIHYSGLMANAIFYCLENSCEIRERDLSIFYHNEDALIKSFEKKSHI